MGTRGLMGFIIKGVRKGAHNHFDSYPSGLGNDIVRFILSLTEEEIIDMQAKVEALEWIEEEDVHTHNRDLLSRIQAGQTQVGDATEFIYDLLFCEYAYYVDFENREVEVTASWKGFEAVWTFDALAIDCFEYVNQDQEQE